MKAKLILSGLLTLLLVASAVSADNTVYLEPQTVYVPECGNATVQIRLNSTDTIDTWSTMVEFGSECVNITDVSFAEGVTPEYANWGHHEGYIYLGGVSPDDVTGDHLLATLTVECVDGNCGSVGLSIVGDADERLIAGPGDNDPPHATIYPATWMGGSAQIVGRGNVNAGEDGTIDMADVTLLLNHVYDSTGYPLNCGWAGNVNAGEDGAIDMADVTLLLNHVYDSAGYPLSCEGPS
jgi:hypothetical protein